MAYKVVTPPVIEPFTVAYAKAWLRIPSSITIEDTLIEDMIKGARDYAEKVTNKAMLTQTINEFFDCFPCGNVFKLSVSPIQSITSISYMINGSYTVFNSSNYHTDLVSEPARIVLKDSASWPTIDTQTPNAVKVVYVAGATAASGIPQTSMDAMLQRLAYLYENREDMPLGGGSNRVRSADALLAKNRTIF